MVDHVAKTLCRAATSSPYCAFCDEINDLGYVTKIGPCTLWPTFRHEALCAIEAVRDFARLDRRTKPHPRDVIEIVKIFEKDPLGS